MNEKGELETPAEIHAALSLAEQGSRFEGGLMDHIATVPTAPIDTSDVEPLPVSPEVEEALFLHGKLADVL